MVVVVVDDDDDDDDDDDGDDDDDDDGDGDDDDDDDDDDDAGTRCVKICVDESRDGVIMHISSLRETMQNERGSLILPIFFPIFLSSRSHLR